MHEQIPNFVGQAQAAAVPICIALAVAVLWLAIENWPEMPNRRR